MVVVDSLNGRFPQHCLTKLMGTLAGKIITGIADERVAFAGFGNTNDAGIFSFGAFWLIHEDSIIEEIKLNMR